MAVDILTAEGGFTLGRYDQSVQVSGSDTFSQPARQCTGCSGAELDLDEPFLSKNSLDVYI